VHLDADAVGVRQEAQEESTAGRHAVQQGVGRQFTDAQQYIVRADAYAPLLEHLTHKRPRARHGPALTVEETLTWGGVLGQG
jgi:hypothetical protein